MNATIIPSFIKGEVLASVSKSAMQRACAAALIRKGRSVITNCGNSDDDKAAVNIIKQLGATVQFEDNKMVIDSNGINPVSGNINCGESGLSVRMFTSIAALASQPITVDGSGSLIKRPLHFFDTVFPQLSVSITSQKGYLPLSIKGPLTPRNITIDGSLSSQFLTGLLFAYSAAHATGVTIFVTDLNSKPYVDLTLHMLKQFGLKVPVNHDYKSFYFGEEDRPERKETVNYTVEGDWSGAAFLLVAGAINGELKVKGLDLCSTQADKAILEALSNAEAKMSVRENEIVIQKSTLKAFHFNATHCPDLFPPLVALASYCTGTTIIEGVHRLAHKESNRALTLQDEFEKMGVTITLQDDLMIIEGAISLKGGEVHSRHDHRIAMACAVAALGGTEQIMIAESDAINKSYPHFYQHLQQLGAQILLTGN
ncbi:MAG: 3-phosphoshikimate 1-carboxyvinyltransferase [Chitinophagaceae bacterium]